MANLGRVTDKLSWLKKEEEEKKDRTFLANKLGWLKREEEKEKEEKEKRNSPLTRSKAVLIETTPIEDEEEDQKNERDNFLRELSPNATGSEISFAINQKLSTLSNDAVDKMGTPSISDIMKQYKKRTEEMFPGYDQYSKNFLEPLSSAEQGGQGDIQPGYRDKVENILATGAKGLGRGIKRAAKVAIPFDEELAGVAKVGGKILKRLGETFFPYVMYPVEDVITMAGGPANERNPITRGRMARAKKQEDELWDKKRNAVIDTINATNTALGEQSNQTRQIEMKLKLEDIAKGKMMQEMGIWFGDVVGNYYKFGEKFKNNPSKYMKNFEVDSKAYSYFFDGINAITAAEKIVLSNKNLEGYLWSIGRQKENRAFELQMQEMQLTSGKFRIEKEYFNNIGLALGNVDLVQSKVDEYEAYKISTDPENPLVSDIVNAKTPEELLLARRIFSGRVTRFAGQQLGHEIGVAKAVSNYRYQYNKQVMEGISKSTPFGLAMITGNYEKIGDARGLGTAIAVMENVLPSFTQAVSIYTAISPGAVEAIKEEENIINLYKKAKEALEKGRRKEGRSILEQAHKLRMGLNISGASIYTPPTAAINAPSEPPAANNTGTHWEDFNLTEQIPSGQRNVIITSAVDQFFPITGDDQEEVQRNKKIRDLVTTRTIGIKTTEELFEIIDDIIKEQAATDSLIKRNR